MRKSSLIVVGTVLTVFSLGALASHCPVDMQQIDAALQKGATQLSAEQLAEVKKLRAEGEALHKAGNHAQAVEKLGKAKQILGI
jgi:hypothetical protein